MKKLLPVILCLCLLLSACGAAEQNPGTTGASQPGQTVPVEPSTQPTESEPVESLPTDPMESTPETTVETEPELLYTHPLTGQPLAELFTTRPVGVVTNNSVAAQPLHGISAADVICEIMVEGGGTITRLMAVYTDLENAGRLGTIRSARTYLIDLARNFGAPIVHCGYSDYARNELYSTGYDSFNQFTYPAYFYRDQERLQKGFALEHTMFTEGPDLLAGLKAEGFDIVNEEGTDIGLQFAEQIDLAGDPANRIAFRFYSSGGKQTIMEYNAEEGVYYGTQKWQSTTGSFTDGNTGKNTPFRNVLLLYVKTTSVPDGHMFAELTGEGTGFFACGGQIVPIKWSRASKNDTMTYALEDGTPITFGIGKTYIGIIPTRYPNIEIS